MYALYSAILAAVFIIGLPWWLLQMFRSGKYRAGLGERFGRVPERIVAHHTYKPVIWIHAVSVGEIIAVGGLINEIRERFRGYRIVISTTTLSGQALAREKFGEENVFYFPLDFAFAIRPYLRALRPELVVIAETEFWPNFLRLVRRSGARIAIVNARISDRSFPRYRRWRSLLAKWLANVDLFLAQSDLDRGRLVEIGAAENRVRVSGNLKFDARPQREAPVVAALRATIDVSDAYPVLVCGSTVAGEEPMVLDAFRKVLERFPRATLILAPRHPERWDSVAELVRQSGLPFWLRSECVGTMHLNLAGGIFVLDSIGELASVYSLATVAFVGGSLVPRGGHNILEPAQHGRAIIVGPYTENFRDIVSLFVRAGAVDVVDRNDFAHELLHLLFQEEKREQLGQHAAEVIRVNAGATDRTVDALEKLLPQSIDKGRQKSKAGRRRR